MKRFQLAAAAAAFTLSAAFAADPGLLALIPPDTKVVGGIYADRTANSPFGQYLLSQVKEEEASFKKFVMATGFDPRRDLREVVFAGAAVPRQKGHGLVAARGTFNGAQILAAAKAEGGTTTNYKGVELISGGKGHGEGGVIAILDASLALMGNEATVKRAIDQRGARSALDPKITAKINDVSGRFDAWLVSEAPVSGLTVGAPNTQAGNALKSPALQNIEQTSGGLRFGTIVEFAAEALTKSDKDAQSLAEVIRFLASMMQMQTDKNPDAAKFAKLLDSMEVRTAASTVHISFSVPQADLEQIMKPKRARVRRAAAE